MINKDCNDLKKKQRKYAYWDNAGQVTGIAPYSTVHFLKIFMFFFADAEVVVLDNSEIGLSSSENQVDPHHQEEAIEFWARI